MNHRWWWIAAAGLTLAVIVQMLAALSR